MYPNFLYVALHPILMIPVKLSLFAEETERTGGRIRWLAVPKKIYLRKYRHNISVSYYFWPTVPTMPKHSIKLEAYIEKKNTISENKCCIPITLQITVVIIYRIAIRNNIYFTSNRRKTYHSYSSIELNIIKIENLHFSTINIFF